MCRVSYAEKIIKMKIITKKKTAILFLCTLLCLVSLQNNVTGQQVAAQVPVDPKVKTGKLPNGFTYYIRKNKTQEGRAILYLVNKVGSILETDAQQGLAHFLEHMAFNGTTHFPKNELVNYLQKSGVRFGADLNAYTSFDETVYQLPISSNDKTIFRNAMQIMQDWAQGLTLGDAEIDKERGVILEEKRLRLGSQQRIHEQTMPAMVNDARYASRLPIGTEEVLRKFDHKEIRQFYHDWYRPDLQAIIVVGDIDVDAVEKMIKNSFAGLKNPEPEKERTVYNIPLNGNNQFVMVTDPEVSSVNVSINIKHPKPVVRTDADYKQDMLRDLFNIMAADRMNAIVQQGKSPFVSGSFGIDDLIANLDAFTGTLTLKPGAIKQGFEDWFKELERIKRHGFTETELKRAKTDYMSNLEQAYEERENRSSEVYVQEYLDSFLHGTAIPGIAYEYALDKPMINTITTADVKQLIQEYIGDKNRDINIVAGSNMLDSIPQEGTINKWMQEVSSSPIAAYSDNKTERSKLMEQLPTPGTITNEVKDASGMTTLMLSNGVKVVLKPTHFQKGQVSFRSFSLGGLSLVSNDDFYSGSLSSELVSAGGVDDLSPTELRRLLTGKTVYVSPYISETMQGFSGQSDVDDLETALQLVYLYSTKPRTDPVVFNRFIERTRLSYEMASKSPIDIFKDTIAAVLGNYNFRKMEMPKEGLDKINLEKAMMVYKDRFADANGTTFTFVGSFDEEKIKPLLTRYLGALPSHGRKEEVRDLHLDLPQGKITRKVTAGTEDRAAVYLAFGGPLVFDETTVNRLNALASIITDRLESRLREEESGIYSVTAQTSIHKYPTGQYVLHINFVCDPKNAELLILSTTNELMKLKTEGPSEDDIIKYQATSKGALARAKQSNGFWLGFLTTQLSENGSTDVTMAEKNVEKVNVDNIRKTAQEYLNYGNYISIILKPLK